MQPNPPRAHDEHRARLARGVPALEWAVHEPTLDRIWRWKKARGAIVLAHNYQRPEVFHGIADVTGDSLALAQHAAETDAEVIVMCGVHFMAETAKLLNPDRVVLLPDLEAGCSLAQAITGDDVRRLRARHPGVPVVTYVNTSAEVKAESDICCTSANAVDVVRSLGSERVIFLPDAHLGRYVAATTHVELILFSGRCEVHDRFRARDVEELRRDVGDVYVVAHPECPPDVLAGADFVGSTTAMIRHLGDVRPPRVALLTECSMADNLRAELPDIDFLQPCNLCPHMARITLEKVADALEHMHHAIEVPSDVAPRARRAIERMLEVRSGEARP